MAARITGGSYYYRDDEMAKSAKGPNKTRDTEPAPSVDGGTYATFVGDLKRKIAAARLRASLSVNRELILLYWGIGRDILVRQEREGWGGEGH